MSSIFATIRLRPIRIGFLVRPTDMTSIRKIMRSCACLWGGRYNPIIPVFQVPPKAWKPAAYERMRGVGITRGYITFFEPDIFVEAEQGLLEKAGLGALREHIIRPKVVLLEEFLTPRNGRDWSEPAQGLGMTDVFNHLYETEQRFQAREQRPSILVKPERGGGLVEAVFGAFPTEADTAYIAQEYADVFKPDERTASATTWLEVYERGARTPLRLTGHGLDFRRYWYHDPIIYVFNPKQPTDLIDLWNMRLEPNQVLPIPIDWLTALREFLHEAIRAHFRPLVDNPSGIMHSTTMETARSIGKRQAEELVKLIQADLPQGALRFKHWRNRIWNQPTDDYVRREPRLEITAAQHHTSLTIDETDGRLTASLETLSPEFASPYGGHDHRWVNAVRVSAYGSNQRIATVFPFNTFDRRWPRLRYSGEEVLIGSEGFSILQRFKEKTELLRLPTKEEAVIGSLRLLGIEAKLSEPGLIAKQMVESLDGLSGVGLLADLETIQLLNKMAGGLRRKANDTDTVEETFERRTASVKDWTSLVSKRKQRGRLSRFELEYLTKRNVIRLGLETTCPNCQATNWHSLTSVDYRVTCDRCLKDYGFPQASLKPHNENWFYRVVGPFSVPDYARGSYSALLTLRALNCVGGQMGRATFSTALDLEFDGVRSEIDFAAWQSKENLDGDNPPELVIGEAKSLGTGDLIKLKDIEKLKAVARKLPGAFLVLSVMRQEFTVTEKKLLEALAKWGRRRDERGLPTNPVILLTGHELFVENLISDTWEELGGVHAKYSKYQDTRTLHSFADATQQIYLGLPSFSEWRTSEWEKRAKQTAKHDRRVS